MNEPIGDHCPCCGAVEADWNGNYADTDWETMDRLRARVAELEALIIEVVHHGNASGDEELIAKLKAATPKAGWTD